MACSHRADCPLFPNLKSSLSGWRTHYCDTEDAWLNCARYTRSLAGKPVPISLLPNGKLAQVLDSKGGGAAAGKAAARPDAASAVGGGGVVLAERTTAQPAKRSWWSRLFGRKAAS